MAIYPDITFSIDTCKYCKQSIITSPGREEGKVNNCQPEEIAIINKKGFYTKGYRLHKDFCPAIQRRIAKDAQEAQAPVESKPVDYFKF